MSLQKRAPDGRARPFLASPLSSVVVVTLFLALLTTMLARSPQNGDGAEVVAAALQGGVLHPPGFPLIAWLSRVAIAVPLGNPVERIAFLNAVCHAATLLLLLEILRRLGVGFLPRLTAGLAYATFPSVWYLGTQTEVFSLAYLLMALLTWIAITIVEQAGPARRSWALLLGVVAGLGLAQHPIFATSLGAFFLTLNRLRCAAGRLAAAVVWAPLLVAAAVTAAGYLSLLALHRPGCWPDWGQLETVADVIRHASRAEYGSFTLMSIGGARSARGIVYTAGEILVHWHVLLLALCFAPRRGCARLLWANLLLASAFLFIAKGVGEPVLIAAVLERFEGTLLIPAALLIGLGLERSTRPVIQAGALTTVLIGAGIAYPSANSRRDDTMQVYRQALADSLQEDEIYLGTQNAEVFYGVPRPDGGIRMPIAPNLYSATWYRDGVLPWLEPRFEVRGFPPFPDVVKALANQGFAVFSTDPDAFGKTPLAYRREGLFTVATRDRVPHGKAEVAGRIRTLCASALQLRPLPAKCHHDSRMLFLEFADALYNCGRELAGLSVEEPWSEAARLADKAARGLQKTTDERLWKPACEQLEAQLRPLDPDGGPGGGS